MCGCIGALVFGTFSLVYRLGNTLLSFDGAATIDSLDFGTTLWTELLYLLVVR